MSVPGFDSDAVLTADDCKQFYNEGYRFAIRYLSLGPTLLAGDISYNELYAILNTPLGVYLVQHVRYPGWMPTWDMGAQDGQNSAAQAKAVGYQPGKTIWLDLEGVNPGANPQDIINYCTAWYDTVFAGGFVPGLYVGANSGLTGDQLTNLPFKYFWKSCSTVPELPGRMYSLVQECLGWNFPKDMDRDTLYADAAGNTPPMMSKALIEV